jgi:hypothetical protein
LELLLEERDNPTREDRLGQTIHFIVKSAVLSTARGGEVWNTFISARAKRGYQTLTGVVDNYRSPELEVPDVPDDLFSTVPDPTAEDLVRVYGALDDEARSVENNAGLPFHEMDWFDEDHPEFAARTPHRGSSSSESYPPAMTDSADMSHDEDDNGLPLRGTNTHNEARVYSAENANIFERFTEEEGAHNADAGDEGKEAGVMYEEEEHADTDLEEVDADA